MKNIQELLGVWLYCQTKLKKTLRWSKYVQYARDGKLAKHNGIRRQNVADHTLSKLFAFSMLLPSLMKIEESLGKSFDFNLLFTCIINHDFGEGLKNEKYDVLANDKKDSHDLQEYLLVMELLKESGLQDEDIGAFFKKSFLLQFALTSYEIFPEDAQEIMRGIRQNRIECNTALLFQIVEKWEYFFYAYENENKRNHPTIFEDVFERNIPLIKKWIHAFPKGYHKPLKEIFLS